MKTTFRSIPDCPPALGPYSLAVQSSGPLLFVSGMTPWNPATGRIERGTIAEQTGLVLENIRRIVEGAGASLADTVSCRVYLRDLNNENFQALNAVYAEYFSGERPGARHRGGSATGRVRRGDRVRRGRESTLSSPMP